MKYFAMMLVGLFVTVGSAFAAVNLNTATQSELESIKGLGPTKSKAILEYREKNGPFKSVDELDKVKGFGKATINKLRAEFTIDGKAESKTSSSNQSGK